MNLENAASLVREDITTISVHFQRGRGKSYIFKTLWSTAERLFIGDYVLVECLYDDQPQISVGIVDAIHHTPQIDTEADFTYSWAFQKVDLPFLEDRRREDSRISTYLHERRRENVRSQVHALLGTDSEQIKKVLEQKED